MSEIRELGAEQVTQASSDSDGGDDGLWRLAVVLDAEKLDSPFQYVRASPMRLLVWLLPPSRPPGDNSALAICKLSLFDTFDNVHEYQTPKGVQLRAANTALCRYPHVTLASYHYMESGRETVLMNLDTQSLERNTGLSRTTTPTILVASQAFLVSHGYTHLELVWCQITSPLPLQRVIMMGGQGTIALTPSLMRPAMEQLACLLEKETVILRQNTVFSLPGSFSVSGSKEERRHGTVELCLLECSPVLQGRLTRETEVVVVPQGEGVAGDGPPSLSRLRRSHSLTSSGEMEASWETTKSRSASVLSNCSASDFRNEDDLNSDPSLEVVTHPLIKLHRHYVMVPKQFATDHELFQYQTVLLVGERSDRGVGLADMVLSTRTRSEGQAEGCHPAIVIWYDGQVELDHYLPPPYPGYHHDDSALQCAYVHPHLMYGLFHETLSPTRRYLISIKSNKGGGERVTADLPKAKVISLAPVGVARPLPDLSTSETKAVLMSFFQQRTHLLMTGDIFHVDFEETGSVYFRVMETSPRDSMKCDSTLRELMWQEKKTVNYPLPCESPPCPLLPTPPYFSQLLPPGLEEPCLSLFSLLLPFLYSDPTTRPLRTPAILLSGPEGVGKTAVARAVARRLRANLLELNCYDYCSDSVPTVEKKFALDAAKAFQCAPCMVVLRNIHMIGRDAKRDEPRLASAFRSYMFYVSEYNRRPTVDFPIVVVATCTRPAAIPAQVAMEILHVVELATPTESQRLAMLRGVAGDYLTSPTLSWTQLARETAGFVLGDLVSLMSRASHTATSSAIHYYSCPQSASLAMAGVVISENHMQTALSALHTAHSDAIGAPKIPDVRWEDVGGLSQAKQEVLDAIQLPLQHPDMFGRGLRRSGVLLYGPPGTGKTLLAKAVATECRVHFLSVKGPELINMYVGQTEENVREIFARARGAAPCIIFFDELDSIAPSRGKTGDASGVMDRVVSQLLAELDGLQKSSDVFVIGATNRPDLLDSALLRPGRFDRLVYLGISDNIDSRLKILRAITRKFNLAPDVDLCDLAAQCPAHVTGADLYSLCSEALLGALRQTIQGRQGAEEEEGEGDTLVVSADHFQSALSHLTPSVTQTELERYEKLRQTSSDHPLALLQSPKS